MNEGNLQLAKADLISADLLKGKAGYADQDRKVMFVAKKCVKTVS